MTDDAARTPGSRYALTYEVSVADAHAHLLELELRVQRTEGPLPQALTMLMPVWTPGSYLVREYARHVEGLRAMIGGLVVRARKTRKNRWTIDTDGASEVTISYRVYANEVTVRTNHCDTSHAYWNGAATYLVPEDADELTAVVAPDMPEAWQIATALSETSPGSRRFLAQSLDELMDSPFECGPMTKREMTVLGRTHEIWVWANRHEAAADWDRLAHDTRLIVETEARLLAGARDPASALPYDRYAFLWHVSPRGRGGLEHAASASLLVSPALFSTRAGYLDVLSLVAHEFLHLWNVKRIRPQGLSPYRYETENHTRLLWWFEGATSYFDWRVLRLSKLASAREYADHLAGELARLSATPGALVHALSDASFDAWIKAYRPDESSVNTTVSYYLKGECVSALLDLELRARSGGRRSLDDVLRSLWRRFGETGTPVPEDGLPALFEEATGVDVSDLFAAWVDSAGPLDVETTLAKVGLVHQRKPSTRGGGGALGVRVRSRTGRVVIDSVLRGSAAMRAGLDPGDELLSIGGRRVDDAGLDGAIAQLAAGQEVDVVMVRDGLVETRVVKLDPPPLGEGRLIVREGATSAEKELLDGWLGHGAAEELSS